MSYLRIGLMVVLFLLGVWFWLRRDEQCLQEHYEQQYSPDSKYRAGGVRTQWVCDSSVSRR
jgi:hypothetical protein